MCFRDIVLLWEEGGRERVRLSIRKKRKDLVEQSGFFTAYGGGESREKKKKNNWGEMRTIMGKQKLKKRRRWCKGQISQRMK